MVKERRTRVEEASDPTIDARKTYEINTTGRFEDWEDKRRKDLGGVGGKFI